MRIGKDLVAASATPIVLSILTEGETYGYAISKRVNEMTDGQLEWTDGMLYPLLHRLDRLGLVESFWRQPERGRRRKYYRITQDGREALADIRNQWTVVTAALERVWRHGAHTAMALNVRPGAA